MLAATVATAQQSAFPDAREHIRLVRAKDAPWPAPAAYAEVCPNTCRPPALHCRVVTGDGRPLRHHVLWAAEGAPLKIMFDSSSQPDTVEVYLFDGAEETPSAWQPVAGIVLETREYADGVLRDLDGVRAMWDASPRVLGRSVVDAIFQGQHPHGPTYRFLARYVAALEIRHAGVYSFATLSDDASFLLVNGVPTAAWPGTHAPESGRYGEHSGPIALPVGTARLEYFNAQPDQGFQVAAAWKPPGKERFHVIPTQAFVPVARFDPIIHERAGGGAAVTWSVTDHVLLEDLAFVRLRFTALPGFRRQADPVTWRFDDGSVATGTDVSHVFLSAGMRDVAVQPGGGQGDGQANGATLRIDVHPRWEQIEEWPWPVYDEYRKELLARELASAPVRDLIALVRMSDKVQDWPLLAKAGAVVLSRHTDFTETPDVFYRLGLALQRPELKRYVEAETAFRLLLAAAEGPLRERARLHLAGFLAHGKGDAGEALALLEEIDTARLTPDEDRQRRLYIGDARLARGKVDDARAQFIRIGTVVPMQDTQYVLRRRARLEAALDYLRRGEYEAVENTVRAIEWETPLARMDVETGIPMIRAHIARGELPFALQRCLRLLQAAGDSEKGADLLLYLAEIYDTMGSREGLRDTLLALREKHPYSEAAARAHDRWGDPAGRN